VSRELGKLAKWLRILGFDTVYFRQNNKSSLVITAMRENRVVLTRNNKILEDRLLKTIFVKSLSVKEQLKEVLSNLDITPDQKLMFTRCTICNTQLEHIEKDNIKSKVPSYVFDSQEDFFCCKVCGRIYWRGSHWGNVVEVIKGLKT